MSTNYTRYNTVHNNTEASRIINSLPKDDSELVTHSSIQPEKGLLFDLLFHLRSEKIDSYYGEIYSKILDPGPMQANYKSAALYTAHTPVDNKTRYYLQLTLLRYIINRRVEDRKKQLLIRLTDLIEVSYKRSDLTIAEIAKKLGLGLRDLNRKCKNHFQTSPKHFLNEYRLNEAIRLIDRGKAINIIAFSVGFSTLSSFGRNFKKRFGCSLSEYREKFPKENLKIKEMSKNG